MNQASIFSSKAFSIYFPKTSRLIATISILAMIAVAVIFYGASFWGLLGFLAFAIFYLQLPGLLLLNWSKLDFKHISSRLSIGFMLGWCALVLIYFVSDLLSSRLLLAAFCPLLSLLYIFSNIRNKNKFILQQFRFSKLSACFALFFALILLYCLINTQYIYPVPDMVEFTYLNPDKAYHLGLIDSLSHDYPLMSPWIYGVEISYHIFSEVVMSVPVALFGMDSDFVLLSCGPYMTAYAFGTAIYAFFAELSSKPKRAGIYCLILLLSNIYPCYKANASLAFKFILINDNSSGYGIAAALVILMVFDRWLESFKNKDSKQWKQLVLLTALIMLATGIKGPLGAVLIGALWGVYILALIMKKLSLRFLIPLMIMTAGFALIYFVILGSKGQSNAGGTSIFAFATISNICFWKTGFVALLKSLHIPRIIRLALVMLVFMIFFTTIYFIPFCAGYIRELYLVLTGKKDFNVSRVLVYAAFLVGLIAMFILSYGGHSQVYFGLISVFLVPIIAIWFVEDMQELAQNNEKIQKLLKAIYLICGISILVTSISLVSFYIERIQMDIDVYNNDNYYPTYMSISDEEYEAMKWIEENTPEDALLATDRYYSTSLKKFSVKNRWDNRFFLYAVYANRYCYLAGSGYNLPAAAWDIRKEMIETNNKLYYSSDADRAKLAKKLGIDYIVVSKRFTDVGDLSSSNFKLCFSNEDVDIYEVVY